MENSIEYLIKVNGLMALFLVVYFVFLRKETFFQYNRWFLNVGLLASLALPFVILKQIVWIEKPIVANDLIVLSAEPMAMPTGQIPDISAFFDWNIFIVSVYFLVFIVLVGKFLKEFYSYKCSILGKKFTKLNGVKTIETNENTGPFSFFKTIVINPSLYSETELKAIISHENVHVRQFHSFDVLVSKIFTIVFWYNPIVWSYRKFMIQNLEYIADNKAIENNTNLKQYQYTLLKHTTNRSCVALTNPFYQSLIKKRIVMLNKKPSARANRLKLAIVLPMLAIFIWQFQTKIIAQEKVSAKESVAKTPKIEILINKNTSDAFMAEYTERLKREFNIDLKFSKIKRNSKGELTAIKVFLNDNNRSETEHEVQSDKAIEKFLIVYDAKNGKGEIGFYTKKFKDSKKIPLTSKDDDVSQTASEIASATAVLMKETPMPPLPPMPPSPIAQSTIVIEEMLKNMPQPPIPPTKFNDKKSMIQFAKSMKIYEDKIVEFEKEIDETQKVSALDREIYNQKMKAYDDVMREHELKMKAYDSKMAAYISAVREAYVPSDSIDVSNREDKTEDKPFQINKKKRVIAARKEIIEQRKMMLAKRKQKIDERQQIGSERRRIVFEKRRDLRRSRSQATISI